jgi:hypothetical protein
MAQNTPTFRNSVGSVAMTTTYNTIVYDYYPLVSIADRPIFWDARYAQEWASGKVAYEHNKLLSSGIGNKVIKILNQKILGGNLIFKKGKNTKSAGETVDFIREKCSDLEFDTVVESVDLKRLAGGSAYFVLNPTKDKTVTIDALGIDQAYVTFQGSKPVDAKLFINFIDDNSGKSVGSARYFLIEHRYFKDGKPYTINKIYKATIPQWEGASSTFLYGWKDDKSFDAQDVTDFFINDARAPQKIKDIIQSSGLIFGYEFALPFKGLGIVHAKASSTSLKHPNSKYGDPVLANCFDLLWTYDYAYSILSKDLYTGRPLTFIPDTLNGNKLVESSLGDSEYANLYYNRSLPLPALFDDEFVKVPNYSMDYQVPTTVQYDIRAEKIRIALDTIASNIAQCVGISPTQLIAETHQVNETKTAFEVQDETSVVNTNIIRKRQLLQIAINEVIDELCLFYNKSPKDVIVCFPPLEELNKTLMADYIVKLRSVNGMSDEMLVNLAYKDLTEAEKEEEVKKIKELKTEEKTFIEKKNLNGMDNNYRKSDDKESEEIVDEDKDFES